ncbi:serologically defined colon cancer antigen 1 [Delitschia confertaspora ATCC 74209]|uniref:Ribosome quality control complex subunit 2 n=1 Tax=Delitschia confertaspora ATCC 74209 TaxID=1513339 RepID=A0A9P4MSC1_9PLEO|nr:serologically defined colon cancer antigen 1 [Delitschia confertaspora ATCC 74209]
MKQRFSSLDVKVLAHELNKTLVPLRVTNIYDLSSRIFLFKFHKPDHREQLVVDSGFRCHLTSYARSTASAPSSFVAKLRKYLKTRRVTKVSQVGTDRIIEFEFSDGLYKLYLEFYAGGNIVLTDGDLKILALLRNVDEGAEHEKLRVGLEYNLSLRQNYGGVPPLTKERLREGLQKAVERQQEMVAPGKKGKKQQKDLLRKAVAVSITECPPLLVEHALHVANFEATLKPEQVLADDALLDNLLAALEEARKISEDITNGGTTKGYILAKPNPAAQNKEPGTEAEASREKKSGLLYEDFHPFRPQQFENSDYTFLEFDTFNKTVDEFFSSVEGQKLESRLHEREMMARKKLEATRQEHANRIGGLQQVQEQNIRKAQAIQGNVERVSEATAAVNGLIGQGMDWGEIARLIEREQTQGNPVAQMIKLPLKLYENTITILLDEPNWEGQEEGEDEGYETSSVSEDSDDEETAKPAKKAQPPPPRQQKLAIDIDLGLTAWQNATEYFEQKRSAADKQERTIQASSKALKSTERKVEADLKKGLKQEKDVLRPVRKAQWFEKFIYFISSDGYLVLGGKDAQQQEIIYRRYLRKGDVYVHADLKGAVPLIIKNKPNMQDAPIPPSTLSQAGNLSVSTSEAWDSKAVMSAWWVNSDQVRKTATTGEYLAPGVFVIEGKKNFLPPAQLILGFAVMFEISEESKANHLKHRVVDQTSAEKPFTSADTEAQGLELSETTDNKHDDSDSDEDFPDAKIESESEDDFPDAKIESGSGDSDGEDPDSAKHANPLQSTTPIASNNAGSKYEMSGGNSKAEESAPPAATDKQSGRETQEDSASVTASTRAEGKSGPRHLSARERRLLRKGLPLNNAQVSSESASAANAASDEEDAASGVDGPPLSTVASAAPISNATKTSGKAPLPRGKRSKAKKLAAKYADQDEEERALAMRLLGSKSGQQAAEAQAQARKAKEEEALANKQRRREQHLRAQVVGHAAEEARRVAHEGGAGAQDDDDNDEETIKQQLSNLNALVGRPLPGDSILSAIPVCAPWAALATYKYKAKLQPGVTKRGKAVKEILTRWDAAGKDPRALDKHSLDVERVWPREIELVRGWKEAEVVGVLPVGKVRVMMGGGQGAGAGAGAGKKGSKSGRGGRGSKKVR